MARALIALPLFLLLALLPLRSGAEEVVAGLSQTRVAITTGFSGSEIFIYGAVKREAPPPTDEPLEVVVVVIGPSEPAIVRRKERNVGIWVNGPGLHIDEAPTFYAVSTTRPFRDVMSWTDDMRYRVGLDHVIRQIDAANDFSGASPEDIDDLVAQRDEYLNAVVRLRQAEGVYYEKPGGVTLTEETLFRTQIELPPTLVEGDYKARIFLTRGREVIDFFETSIDVRKEGLERWIDTMARDYSALYGILSIVVALAAGWAASTFFRVFLP